MTDTFGLVAGSGDLVPQIVAAATSRGVGVHVFALTGRTDLKDVALTNIQPDRLDLLFAAIRAEGLSQVLLAGYVAEATWRALHDLPAMGFPPGSTAGTAELARRLEAVLPELAGARLVGIHEIAPEMIAGEGTIAGPALTPEAEAGAHAALLKARDLGWRDVGQAVVVSPEGQVEAEDKAGTDALLARIAVLRGGGARASEPGWILAKALKPHQPLSMDVPVIGPATIEHARLAGISIIAVEANGAVIVDRKLLEKAAVAAGIAVAGLVLEPVTP